MTNDEIDATTAAAALRDSSSLAQRATREGRWYARYMTVFGLGFAGMTLLLGLGPDRPWWPVATTGAWAVLVFAMVAWATRRPVQPSIRARRYVAGWVGTGLAYGAALFAGLGRELPVWAWLAAAVVVALPLLISAALLRRDVA